MPSPSRNDQSRVGGPRLRSVDGEEGEPTLEGATLVPLDSELVRQLEAWGSHLLMPASALLEAAAVAYLDRLKAGQSKS